MSSAYLDASVILRVVLQQEPALKDWEQLELTVTSVIARVECLRTIERLRHEGTLTDEALFEKRTATIALLRGVDLVDVGVLSRASQPFPTQIATLDAIHLATALLYESVLPANARPLLFATHDIQLARAARAMNFEVIGVPA